ncbi:hypothetical protein PHABIO_319 [Pseudomonas phage Phabio]|uniref:Uncharacterized protein n=1 Tax=Pseudomonas phage Phabio TaxID=2006668 RepID=A0A1Y0SUC9_9CAUD|nr:hypothetical protein MZD05_gp319 [Pseudomonas phage Phabio]ARV76950.1 hypothetical protein PHABIO_319 [Pseudomonas phage Phabio]
MFEYHARVQEINDLLLQCSYLYGNPTIFAKLKSGTVDIDNHTVLLGNKKYRRYLFEYGCKLYVTIQTNAADFGRNNPLFQSSVISILVRHEGEMVNPFLPADRHVTAAIHDKVVSALDFLITKLKEEINEPLGSNRRES